MKILRFVRFLLVNGWPVWLFIVLAAWASFPLGNRGIAWEVVSAIVAVAVVVAVVSILVGTIRDLWRTFNLEDEDSHK